MEVDERLRSVWMNPKTFPSKLWHLVNDPQISSICWDDNGEVILICQETFKDEVLSTASRQMNKYFKTRDFTSFVRQLNLYGFRTVCSDHVISENQVKTMHHFHNPNFKRDNPELLLNMKRLTAANKAKLAAGIETPKQSSRHLPYPKSPEKYSAVEGTDLVAHQGTPCHQYSQQVKGCNTTPQTSQVFVTGHGDSSSELLMDFPSAPPSSPMHQGSQFAVPDGNLGATIPHYSQCSFYAPVYQCCIPGSLDSNMPSSQQLAASRAPVCYPDYSPNQLQLTGQNPNWQEGLALDPRKSYMNLDSAFSVEDEVQNSLDSHLHSTGQQPNWNSADVPDPRTSQLNLMTVSQMENELQAAASITLPTNEKSPGKTINDQSH